jgi:molybdopterin synthase catalytic subunit
MVKVQMADFDLSVEIAGLRAAQGTRAAQIGAIASFVGTVRDMNDVGGESSQVAEMVLEHYPGMTERALEKIVAEAKQRFDIYDALVIHRFGALKPQDQIVLAAAVGAHRGAAFAACEFMMDYLKTEAPFWKKEKTPAGERWVESRESDESAAARWVQAGDEAADGKSSAGKAALSPSTASAAVVSNPVVSKA